MEGRVLVGVKESGRFAGRGVREKEKKKQWLRAICMYFFYVLIFG